MGVSKNRGTPKMDGFIMETPIKMDDLGVPLFSETSMYPENEWFEPCISYSKIVPSLGDMLSFRGEYISKLAKPPNFFSPEVVDVYRKPSVCS